MALSSFSRASVGMICLAGVLSACALPGGTQTGQASAQGAAATNAATTSDSLAQTRWMLTRWTTSDGTTQRHPPQSSQGRPVHLDFLAQGNDYRVGGFSGCNTYRGAYKLAGGTLTITAPASTRMACPSPADAGLERDYLNALASISTFTLDSGGAPRKMTISLANGDTLDFTRGDDPSSKGD